MLIGVPKEIKNHEYRIGLTPAGVKELVNAGHQVLVQSNGGTAIGMEDEHYQHAGATVVKQAHHIFERAELLIKVKEPQPNECKMLRAGQTLFTYLHMAAAPKLAKYLRKSQATCIAYETVTDDTGALPLLAPMSEVAGRMAIQAAAHCLEKAQGGRGILMGGAAGVAPANVTVIGGGVVGLNAARIALGMGANVTLLDRSQTRLRDIDERYHGRIKTLFSNALSIEQQVCDADAVIGAVLVPGASAPKLVTRNMVKRMKKGSVLVDVAIDQGGCFETSHPTTHQSPTYCLDNVIHYCVANIPGAVARTATLALTNATLPYILTLANQGVLPALRDNKHLLNGLNIHRGFITCQAVAQALGKSYCSADKALNASQ